MGRTEETRSTDTETKEPLTGWKVLARHESVVEIVDTLLDMPPHREFNKTELAEFAGVSRRSVHKHLPTLQQLELVQVVPGTSPERYRFNTDSEVAAALVGLDGAVNRAGPDDPTELANDD